MDADQEWEVMMQRRGEMLKEEWVVSARKALDWFLGHLGEERWAAQKKGV